MTLKERLVAVARCWAVANDRSVATLASRAVNDGKLFTRIADGRTPTMATFDSIIAFLRDPQNWRGGVIPADATHLLSTIPPFDHAESDSAAAKVVPPDSSGDPIGRVAA